MSLTIHHILKQTTFIFLLGLMFILMPMVWGGAHALQSYECVGYIKDDFSVDMTTGNLSETHPACTSLDTGAMGFKIPSLGDLLTFAIRVFFVIAGLAALFYMILGAFAWITSGGDKDSITAARDKIQAAVIGMILIVAVLAIIWTLEQVIFNRRICLGLSCPLTLPGLLKNNSTTQIQSYPYLGAIAGLAPRPVTPSSQASCCVCLKPDGSRGEAINTFLFSCNPATGEGYVR